MYKIIIPSLLLIGTLFLQSCEDLSKNTKTGLKYKIHTHQSGAKKAKTREVLLMHFVLKTDKDSIIQSTYRDNNNLPFLQAAPPDTTKDGSVGEGLAMLSEGDSATFYLPTDTIIKRATQQHQQVASFIKPKSELRYVVKLVKVLTMEQAQAENKKMQEVYQKIQAQQPEKDDKIIQDFLAKNKITNAQKTGNKLYYVINKEGNGIKPEAGDKVKANYTGKLLDGTVFDSSDKSGQPIEFSVGMGQVIPGWDEGFAQLKNGTKATLYIPSNLGYGPNGSGPIPPNAVLIFDVELLNVEKAPKQ